MEHIDIRLGNDELYDQLVHEPSLPQASDIQIVTKDKGTREGNPVVVIAFDVQLPDGTIRKAQAVTTVRLLKAVHASLQGRYPNVLF